MVRIENLSFAYTKENETIIKQENNLYGINLHIKKGEFVLLCGESGCGKTTVTRLANALIPHFYEGRLTGQIYLMGQNTADIKPGDLATFSGSVFQNPRSQFFNTDTTSEIAFGLENLSLSSEEIRAKVENTVSVLGIQKLMGRDIFDLSGGEKQLVALASAYAPEPDVFVFDEPSSNLDGHSTMRLKTLLGILKKAGKTIVIAEHRLYYLAGLIDRALYMEQGTFTHEWGQEQLYAMSDTERENYGLRSLQLENLRIDNTFSISLNLNDKYILLNNQPISLRVSDIKAFYRREKPILNGISFETEGGVIIGIAGTNGSGKSTLARTLCGLHKKSSGSVNLDGKILSLSKRTGIFNLVMQESGYQLFSDSVINELYLGSEGKKAITSRKVENILEILSLSEYRERHPMSLSGGQKQRLAIGTVMIADSKVIIFDEPTSGLDFRNMNRVCEIFELLRSKGKIIFVITHDYELLLASCNRVLFLEEGKIGADLLVNIENLERIKTLFIPEIDYNESLGH